MNPRDFLDLMFSPLTFFQRKTAAPPRILAALLIVILVAALYFITFSRLVSSIVAVPMAHLENSQSFQVLRILELSQPISKLVVFFASLQFPFTWGMGALYVVAVCTLIEIDLRFSKILELFGQSFLPFAVFLTFAFVAVTFYLPQADTSGFSAAHDNETFLSATEDYMADIRLSPLMITIGVLHYAFVGWVFLLWAAALRAAAKLSVPKAGLIVGSWGAIVTVFNVLANRYVR